MRKTIISTILLVVALFSAAAQDHLRERVYITTDKDVYVAGDNVWFSAVCMDVQKKSLSDFSGIAYLELHSENGMAQTAKVALDKGRGAGRMELLNTLPTGNYSLIAYTAQSFNEEGFDYAQDAKLLSIFNTFSTDRIADGVDILEPEEYAEISPAKAQNSGKVSIQAPTGAEKEKYTTLRLFNQGSETATFSLSVFHDDAIASPKGGADISSFLQNVNNAAPAKGFSHNRTPEYEGEVISARVVAAGDYSDIIDDKVAIISAPGYNQNLYSSPIAPDGTAKFFTSNIYGDVEIFMEIENIPEDRLIHLELESPFANASVGEIPKLAMSKSLSDALKDRSAGMQIGKVFDADTLYDFLPLREHNFLAPDFKRYILDDYTRFTIMEELFIEYISELKTNRENGKRSLGVLMSDSFNNKYFSTGNSLVMLDGVPILDQESIFTYDPLLVHHIDIYPYTYQFGIRVFSGAVNFVTYKGNLASMKFPDNVRVTDFQGASIPLAFTCQGLSSDYPDYRQTLYWHPAITLEAGQSVDIQCKIPAYSGKFDIVVEGLSADMQPIRNETSFEVR